MAVLGVLAMLLPGCSGDDSTLVTLVGNGIEGEGGSVPNPLGSFQMLARNYGALDAADYDGATYATMHHAAAGGAALSGIDALAGLRGALSGGYSRFQVRLQFATESNGDGLAQLARFDDVGAKLVVEYR